MLNHRKIRALRHVNRFNFHCVNQKQNVAEHSFYVSVYAREFAKIIFKNDSYLVAQTVKEALEHDFEEAVIGDIPYLVRRQLGDDTLADLNQKAISELGLSVNDVYDNCDMVEKIVDFADAYELKIYLEEERKSGNINLYDIERETFARLLDSPVYPMLKKFVDDLEIMKPKRMSEFMSHEGE